MTTITFDLDVFSRVYDDTALLCLLYLSIENQLSWVMIIDQLTTVYGYCVLGK